MLFLAGLLVTAGLTHALPRVILDTDMRSDVDDAGALALLNALADTGECELAGVVASQTGPAIVAAINAINTWYGRGEVPIGLSPVDDQRFPDPYAPAIGDPGRYPSSQNNHTAPDSTSLYRALLNGAPDKSVKIIVIGGQTCIKLLLESDADKEGDGGINRTGHDLVAAKVSGLYLMAGNFADAQHPEHNIMLDLQAAQTIAADWPSPIVYSGYEVGRAVLTGGALTDPEHNPVAKAYELYPAGEAGVIASSPSYDQTTVYYAIRGGMAGDVVLWDTSEPGTATFPEGKTSFAPSPTGRHRFLRPASPPEAAATTIEALMIQPPRNK